MGALDDDAFRKVMAGSALNAKYATPVDRDSAHEILQRKLAASAGDDQPDSAPAQQPSSRGRAPREEKSMIEEVLSSRVTQTMARQAARTVTQQVVRGIFGMLRGK
jgi:hypothetical protein